MKKPFLPIRIVLQVLSVLLCIVLCVGVLVTAVLLDLRTLTSNDGMQSIIELVLSGDLNISMDAPVQQPQPAPQPQRPSSYIVSLGSTDDYADDVSGAFTIPDDLTDDDASGELEIPGDFEIPDDFEIPSEVLTDSNALIDFVYDTIQDSAGDEVDISHDQVQEFVERSTVMDYTSGKMNDYIQDAFNGSENTVITADELMNLFEENRELLEEVFDIEVTEEMQQTIRENVERAVEEEDLNGTVRTEINKVLDTSVPGTELSISDLMQTIGRLTRTEVVMSAVLFCVILMAMLFGLNYYNLGKGLGWISYAFTFIGAALAIPLFILQFGSSSLQLGNETVDSALQVVSNLTHMLAPIHYGILVAGVAMLAGSIVWRILHKLRIK